MNLVRKLSNSVVVNLVSNLRELKSAFLVKMNFKFSTLINFVLKRGVKVGRTVDLIFHEMMLWSLEVHVSRTIQSKMRSRRVLEYSVKSGWPSPCGVWEVGGESGEL